MMERIAKENKIKADEPLEKKLRKTAGKYMGPFEFIYYSGYQLKKTYSLKRQARLPSKVISVGNITVGGTGKTPAVIAIAQEALKRGKSPVILTRGYKGKAKDPCFVSKGSGPLLSVNEAGDEPFLMAELVPGVPIVKCADRYKGGMFALKELNLRPSAFGLQSLIFILDDGFQHWRLYRDMDVLLIDGANPFGNRKLLPSGILREALNGMARADVIVVTKQNPPGQRSGAEALPETLIKEVRLYNRSAPVFLASHEPTCLRMSSGRELPVDTLSGKNLIGFCGIGNPRSFKDTLTRANARLEDFIIFRDHFKYAQKDISGIKAAALRCGADWIVTTEKDIIRLRDFELPENLVSLGIKFGIDEKFYDRLFMEI